MLLVAWPGIRSAAYHVKPLTGLSTSPDPMVVLIVHNQYQQPGGEDESTALEVELLRVHGHEVIEYTEHNDRIREMAPLRVAARTIWSRETYKRARALIRRTRPDVMHVQNFFPLISPSIYYAARAEGVPVVQTLRNYRLLCPSALFLRDGRICEDCLGRRIAFPAVQHACYRGSRLGSAVVAGMLSAHHALKTWERAVDVYVALTEFGRTKFIAGGLPADRIVTKPNFLYPDPGVGNADRNHHLFVGRLTEDKGVMTLLEAWKQLRDLPLRIVGEGPLRPLIARYIADNKLSDSIELLGRVSRAKVVDLLHNAALVVVPSLWYEGFCRVVVEAFACGTPVIASNIGALQENVQDGVQGWLFRPGDADDLARVIRGAVSGSGRLAEMGREGRRSFETQYTSDVNHEQLINIYGIATRRARLTNGAKESQAIPRV